MVYDLASKGKLGWSSGAAAHVTKREEDNKGAKITQWYMAEASLTPTPAEPQNSVIPLKMFLGEIKTETEPIPEAEAAQTAQKVEEKEEVKSEKGVDTMEIDETKLQEMLDKSANSAIKAYVANQPSETPNVEVVEDEADKALKGGWKHPGEFFMAVKSAATMPSEIDKRLLPLKESNLKGGTGANEAIPSEGGFLVTPTIASGIFERMYEQGSLLSLFNPEEIGPNSNGMVYNTIDETSRAEGSRWGGLQGYWLAEGGSKTASQPKFAQVELKLKKIAALCYATDELLQDSTAMASWIQNTVPLELRFMIEDAILNGNGVGKPLGITNSPAFIEEPPASGAPTIVAADILAVWARRYTLAKDYVWLVDPTIVPALAGLTIGNFPVYLPSGSLRGALEGGTMLGRPVIEVEYLPDANATSGPVGLYLIAPSQYKIIQKGGVQSASSIHVQFLTDQSVFRFVSRIDGTPMWNSALTPHSGGETVSPFVALGSTSS
jgi:HK97 family phage major capsid protein